MSYIRIRKHYLHVPYVLLGAFEFFLLFGSFYIVGNVQQWLNVVPEAHIALNPEIALVYAFLFSCGSLAMGVYLALMREGFLAMFFRTLVAYCFLGALAVTILSFVWPALDLGGSNLFWVVMVSTGMTLSVRKVFSQLVDSDQLARRIVILGTGEHAYQLQRDYERNKRGLSIRVLGYVGDADQSIDPRYCMTKPDDWLAFCRTNRVSEIVVAQRERRQSDGGHFPMQELIRGKLGGVEVTNALSF